MKSENVYVQNGSSVKLDDGNVIACDSLPKHVAVIMDGNGRWAKARGKARVEGHKAGAQTVRMMVEESRKIGIEYLTLYAFSAENWSRPQEEVSALMFLFEQYLKSEVPLMCKNGVRLRVIGDRGRLPQHVTSMMEEVEEKTEESSRQFLEKGERILNLTLAISYGSRQEIVKAVKDIVSDVISGACIPEDIDESLFSSYLYTSDVPDPDLLIRTSNEKRISNFLLWQIAYAEIYITDTLWPDFDVREFMKALYDFACRERRYGLVSSEQESIKGK